MIDDDESKDDSLRILVIEDDDKVSKLLAYYLRTYAKVEFADDGESGFFCFKEAHNRQESFDIIFLDIIMPKMDGLECLKTIRKWELDNLYPIFGAKIAMMTSVTNTKIVVDCFNEGCQKFIIKPFTRMEIIDAIDQMERM